MLSRLGWALQGEAGSTLASLRDRELWLALALFALLLTLAVQAPLRSSFDVGRADGVGADLPLVRGFFPPERDVHGTFRWTSERALVQLPGVGQRPIQVTVGVFPVNDEVARRGPQQIEVWAGNRLVTRLPVRREGGFYRWLLPTPPDGSGDQAFELRSATFIPTGDERAIGTPVSLVVASGPGGPLVPPWRSLMLWLLAATLLWLALRRSGFMPRAAWRLILPALLLVTLATLLDPPRTALGAVPAVVALSLDWFLVVGLRATAPAVYARLGLPLDTRMLSWLLLLALAVFGLRYGGKIYPDSMPGDIGFHDNRFIDTVRGAVLLLSRNRGVDFPYPPAFYLLLAPFTLLGIERRTLLQLAGAILDALSPFLIYAIALVAMRPEARRQKPGARNQGAGGGGQEAEANLVFARQPGRRGEPRVRSGDQLWPVVAAAIYSLSAAGFMTTWWNFSTHIFAQCAHLLLVTALIVWAGTTCRSEGRTPAVPVTALRIGALLILLQSFVYLGHFGFWINTTLLSGFGLVALLWASWHMRAWRMTIGVLLGAFIAAELIAALLFYSGYTGLFAQQIRAAGSGGLTGLAGREPAPPDLLWQTLWDAGVRVHFGFFSVPLALAGLSLLLQPPALAFGRRMSGLRVWPTIARTVLTILMGGTFLIGATFAALPFITGSTLSTRWLMFSAWAIAVGAAVAARALWRTGYAGRLLTIVMASYILWVTAEQWLGALAFRIRPPEPF